LYEIRYETNNTFLGQLEAVQFINTTNQSILLGELEEHNIYFVSIRGYTVIGPGPYSPPVYNETLEDCELHTLIFIHCTIHKVLYTVYNNIFFVVPSAAPIAVRVVTISSTQMLVTWDPVPLIHQNGIIIYYEVLYEPLNTFRMQLGPQADNATILSIVLSRLEEDVEYNVSVRASTIVGAGPYTDPITNRTLMDSKCGYNRLSLIVFLCIGPSSPPDNITVMALSPRQIIVSWGTVPPIHQNGPIVSYQVQYFPFITFDGLLMASYSVVTGNNSVVLERLEEFLEYNITVSALTVVGIGVSSDPQSVVTLVAGTYTIH